RRRQDEIQIAEQKRQQEIELRKLEYEERKRNEEMEFELQKTRLGADGERVHIGYREDELFKNFSIDEKENSVCLERLETAQSESESLQIKDTSQQRMMGNLADDLKMVKNKNVDNLKSINDSLVKTNSYYDKNKSGKVSLRKGDIVAVRRKPNTTGESTKTQPRYRVPMVVTQVRPSDTYRISQLEPSNGRPYATIIHVSQLKAWRSWNEDDDDSSMNSHDEPEMQRSKRTVRKPLRYGDFMPDRKNFFKCYISLYFIFCECIFVLFL
ncbi:hypothetical protein AVEN_220374-1, partial [Araneus ventricosus]